MAVEGVPVGFGWMYMPGQARRDQEKTREAKRGQETPGSQEKPGGARRGFRRVFLMKYVLKA